METENWTLCFFCSFPIPASSSQQIHLEVWRNAEDDDESGRRNKQNSWDNLQPFNSHEQVSKKLLKKDVLFKYFLSGCKDEELKENLHSPSFQLELCEICEGRAVDIQELHLELKRTQGKLTDKIKDVKQIIIANSRGTHRLFSHFRTFVQENEDTLQQRETMGIPEKGYTLADEVAFECPWKIEDIPAPVDIKEELKDPLEPSEEVELEMDSTSLMCLVKKEEMEVEEEEEVDDEDDSDAAMNHVDSVSVSNSSTPSKKKPHATCHICQATFTGGGSLLSHKIRVHNHPKLQCDLCPPPGKSYTNYRSLKNHQLSCHPDKVKYIPKKPLKRKSSADTEVFTCELCGQAFENYSKLLLHTNREHPRKNLKCSLCPNSEGATLLSPLDGLPRHLDEVHGMSDLRHTCTVPTCGKIFYARMRLHDHHDRNHKTSHPCKECNKVFSTFSMLRSHNVTVHRETRGLKCTVCSQRFTGGKALLSHKIHVHNHPKLECGVCPKTFMGRLNRKNHWLIHHPEEAEALQAAAGTPKAFRTKCQKDGDKKTDVTIPNVQKSFSCEQCGAVMKSKLSLQQHFKNVHATSRDFCCELCGFRTKTNAYLQDHMKRHNAQLECPQCSRKCPNKSSLTKHMRIHSEEKQFSCEVCGEGFRKMRMLKLHSIKHEMEEKVKKGKVLDPCECPECGKIFSRPDRVKIHMIAHSEERKFKCDECGKKFKMNQDLRKHTRRAHGGDKNT